jgi:hypothetical protein
VSAPKLGKVAATLTAAATETAENLLEAEVHRGERAREPGEDYQCCEMSPLSRKEATDQQFLLC